MQIRGNGTEENSKSQRDDRRDTQTKTGFPNFSETLSFYCAPRRTRTFDLRIKSQLLYQLSYRSSGGILPEWIRDAKDRESDFAGSDTGLSGGFVEG